MILLFNLVILGAFQFRGYIPRKTKMTMETPTMNEDVHSLNLTAKAPENRPSQMEFHLPTIHFRCYVSFRE